MITFATRIILEWCFDTRWSTDPTRGTGMFECAMDPDRILKTREEERQELTDTLARIGELEAIIWFVCFLTVV